jgi:hypothetical protein
MVKRAKETKRDTEDLMLALKLTLNKNSIIHRSTGKVLKGEITKVRK